MYFVIWHFGIFCLGSITPKISKKPKTHLYTYFNKVMKKMFLICNFTDINIALQVQFWTTIKYTLYDIHVLSCFNCYQTII